MLGIGDAAPGFTLVDDVGGRVTLASLLEGGALEPGKFDDIRSILVDYSKTSPQAMQALAARYLQHDRSWRVEVVPEAKK